MERALVLWSMLGMLGCTPRPGATPTEVEDFTVPARHSALRSMAQLEALQDTCGTPMPPARVFSPRERESKFSQCRRAQRRCAEQVGALEPTVRQADADLRREGARILGRITGSHRCHLDAADPCAWLDPSTTPRSICAHLTFAGPTLMAAVTDPDWQVGLAALDGLVVASPRQEDLPTLAAWLRSPPPDDDDGSRFQARIADVLGRAGPEAATTTEALAWLATQRRPNDALQISALRALTAIGPPAEAAVPTLVTLCESDRRSVRYGALEALGAIAPDDSRTREAAERARGDDDEQVRGLAEALSRGRE